VSKTQARRLRLAWPFTISVYEGKVWMVAGEDLRFALSCDEPEWLAALLKSCDGRQTVEQLLEGVPECHRSEAKETLEQLAAERVLVRAGVSEMELHSPRLAILGEGSIAQRLRRDLEESEDPNLWLYSQHTLDYESTRAFSSKAREEARRWMWVTTGPSNRAYVSPLFLPDAGPCVACLLGTFHRLSPVPDFYEVLREHQGEFATSSFPDVAETMLAGLVDWKLSLCGTSPSPPALFALHVVEAGGLTVSSHPVLADPDCTECRH
jgi:bacteriocin biosynthesis cyclodehydratase domain-containing protein